ncbi:MAG: SMC-Scp complex subunit ScpB [Nitrospinae bacterium]|nr:SMC-Scp complex subunit ScpB [Nitrospinota bacterium]
MERSEIKAVIETILLVADAPVPLERMLQLFADDAPEEEVRAALEEVRAGYESRAFSVAEVAEGWRLQTNPAYAGWITRFFKFDRGKKLARASLEVLAIIAYRQPITRAEIDEIRGVDSGGVLRGLIDKTLVKTMGRRKAPGKPMMYGTTRRFLEFFGLARLADLPTLEDFAGGEGELAERQALLDFVEESPEGEEDSGEGEPFNEDEYAGEEDFGEGAGDEKPLEEEEDPARG